MLAPGASPSGVVFADDMFAYVTESGPDLLTEIRTDLYFTTGRSAVLATDPEHLVFE